MLISSTAGRDYEMTREFTARDSKNKEFRITLEKCPDECPCCHKGIEPIFRFAFFHDNEYPTVRNNYVQAVFQCPRHDCFRVFIADYVQFNERGMRGHHEQNYELRDLSPFWYEEAKFPDLIKEVSPEFCKIFNEAADAESTRLQNIAGPGYRKALEFLIKDFLISQNPEDVETIKKTWLQNLIRDRINDANIKNCAERATWLGNDETHYLRVWKDKDITDLKNLIRLSVNWVENYLLTKEYLKSMPEKT